MERNSLRKKNNNFPNDRLTFFIEAVAKFCDRCGTAYDTSNLRIIQESELSSIIHFSCSNCKSQHMATFLYPVGISSRMPLNSDLGVNELADFANSQVVPVDDILDLHMLLSQKSELKI